MTCQSGKALLDWAHSISSGTLIPRLSHFGLLALTALLASCSCVSREAPPAWVMVRQWQAAGFELGPDSPSVVLDGLSVAPGDQFVLPEALEKDQATEGKGTPLVLWRSPSNSQRGKGIGLGTVTPVTALVEGSGDQPSLRLVQTMSRSELDGEPLAVDRQAAYRVLLEHANCSPLVGFQGGFNPGKRVKDQGLYMATPYDPKLVPVVFVHGMLASPGGFYPMLEAIAAEPDLTARYQFWFYSYPTGLPLLENATDLRHALQTACQRVDPEGDDSALSRMVIVGHSMGGLMARLAVSRPEHHLYDAFFQAPITQLRLTPAQEFAVRDALLYDPIPWPKRLVFIATPHQGSDLAGRDIVRWAANKVKLPGDIGDFVSAIRAQDRSILTPTSREYIGHIPNSIQSFDSDDPIWSHLRELQFRQGVVYHNLIGVRDPVVSLESSRFPGAVSELIVNDGHGIPTDPEAIAEVIRILREY